MHVGRTGTNYNVHMPFIGKLMGKPDGVYNATIISLAGDLSYEFGDPDVIGRPDW